uniref:SH2 domain-containing protein n=1 Tax=Gadus morhua TaxID=8049 RepID=A0A8C5F4K1_GADMO
MIKVCLCVCVCVCVCVCQCREMSALLCCSLRTVERVRMEWSLGAVMQTKDSEGGLRARVLRCFTETQETLILHNGNFPAWFRGFTARKDAEDLLRDKTMGCFLIHLSDKILGFILSYKHVLLKQLSFLPTTPYGEYLTYCCSEVKLKPSELYDVVRFETREKSGVSVQVLKTLWNQMSDKIHGQNHDGEIIHKPLRQNIFPDVQPTTTGSNKPQQLSEGPDEMGRRPLSTESIDRSHNEYPTQYKNHDYSGSSPVEKRSMYQPILDRDTVEDAPMVTLRTTDYTVATEEGHLRHLLPSYTKGCHETAGQDRPPDGRPLFPQIQPALPAL